MSDELKPCPFCGGEASGDGRIKYGRPLKDATWDDDSPITEAFFANCPRCGVNNRGNAGIGHRSRHDAIAAWNRRAPEPGKDGNNG